MPGDSNQTLTSLSLRDARPEEAEAVGALVRAAYAQFEAAYPADWARYYEMIGEMERHFKYAQVIVAEALREPFDKAQPFDAAQDEPQGEPFESLRASGSVLVGAVIFYPDGSLSGQGEWPLGWAGVLRLAVHPDYRGQGIARALMDECIRRTREAGIATLALHTTEWMGVSAMYERMGFVRDESFDFIPRPGIYAFGYKLDLEANSK